MKKYVKRFLAVFPAVLILILTIIPFSAFGAGSNWGDLSIPDGSFTDLKNLNPELVGIKDTDSYIFMKHNNGDWAAYFVVVADDKVDIIDNFDGTITYTFYGSTHFAGTVHYNSWSGLDGWDHRYSTLSFTFDSVKSEIISTDFFGRALGVTPFQVTEHLLDSSMPDIQVEFNPNLSGTVDRRISNGTNTSLLQDLNFSITNYSKFAVQYKFWIDMKNPVTSRNGEFDSSDKKGYYETHFDDDPVFVYYSNERVYSVIDTESASGMFSPQNVALFDKPSEWHYLKAGETFSEVFPFAMINLTEGTDYVVHVWVNKCDYDHPSTNLMTSEDTPAQEGYPANPNYKEVDQKYRYHFDSDFSMLQYSDVKYDPTIKAGSSLPYDGSKGISNQEQYRYMYDAKTDLTTGETNIGHVDLYNDPHSWVNKNYVYSPSYISSGSSSFKFSNLLASTSSFFSFFSAVLGYFPPILLEVVSLALLSFLTIAIIRRIH